MRNHSVDEDRALSCGVTAITIVVSVVVMAVLAAAIYMVVLSGDFFGSVRCVNFAHGVWL